MIDEGEISEYEFELVGSDDPTVLILVCSSAYPLSTKEYSEALINYALQIVNEKSKINNSLN